jgi:putative addiction module CopG family antidote
VGLSVLSKTDNSVGRNQANPLPSSDAISDHFEPFIGTRLAFGRYASASELMRERQRLLEEPETFCPIELVGLRLAFRALVARRRSFAREANATSGTSATASHGTARRG